MSISVQKLCQQKGISLLSLAEQSGIDLKRLQAIFLGHWTSSVNQRAKIAQALDTPSDEISWQHVSPVEHFYGP